MEVQQLSLIPEKIVNPKYRKVVLSELPPDEEILGPAPTLKIIESIKRFGVLQPIVLTERGDNNYLICEGRRRIKAARAAGLVSIPAHVYPSDWSPSEIISLVASQRQQENPAADLQNIENLIKEGKDEKEIIEATGLPKPTLNKRLKLLNLLPELKSQFLAGNITPRVALVIATLEPSYQQQLLDIFNSEGEITSKDVKEVKRERTKKLSQSLPNSLFDNLEPVAWEVQANSLLEQLTAIVPVEMQAEFFSKVLSKV